MGGIRSSALKNRNECPSVIARFFAGIRKADSGCWEWQRPKSNGYGSLRVKGRLTLAHRYSYSAYVGPIPDGLQIDHLCRNTRCVNPDHLEPVTRRENCLRAPSVQARRAATHCAAGHPFAEVGFTDKAGRRRCRSCKRIQDGKWTWAEKQARRAERLAAAA